MRVAGAGLATRLRKLACQLWTGAAAGGVACALCVACAAETSPSGTKPDAGPPDPDAPKVCFEMADVVSNAAVQRCRQDKQANYDAFVAQAKCAEVTNIRNIVELRRDCFATDIPRLSCAQLVAGRLPTSCAAQLIR